MKNTHFDCCLKGEGRYSTGESECWCCGDDRTSDTDSGNCGGGSGGGNWGFEYMVCVLSVIGPLPARTRSSLWQWKIATCNWRSVEAIEQCLPEMIIGILNGRYVPTSRRVLPKSRLRRKRSRTVNCAGCGV